MSALLAGRADALGAGLLLGLAATLGCLGVGVWWRGRHPGQPAPVAGLALAAAGAAGIALATDPPATLALPAPVIAAAAVVAGLLLADFDRRRRHGVTLPLLAVSAAGVWATVPDVEAALVVVGAALPMALLGWPSPLARLQQPPALGVVGAFAVAGLFAWAAAAGAAGRPGAAVGGLACLGVLVVEPAARRLDPRRRGPLDASERPGAGWLTLAGQVALVGVASRVVGRPERAATALLLAALELGLAVVAGVALARRPWFGRRTAP